MTTDGTGTQGGDTTKVVEEPALVSALVAPLLKLRAALGTGARPDDKALSALTQVSTTVRASEDTHRSGATQLTSAETALAAVPAITKTTTETAGLADVSDKLTPLLTSAYDTRDQAATKLDTLIANFRAQATPLVKTARSQADLDTVVNLAADYVTDGVNVVKAADGDMDTYTTQVKQISADSPGVTVPAATVDTTGKNPSTTNTTTYPNTYNNGWNSQYPNSNNNGWNSNYSNGWNNSSYNNGTNTNYLNSSLAQSNPELAAQLTLQTALISAGVTLGSALITGGVTLGSALIDKGSTVITTAIEKGEAYGEKALAANTTSGTTTTGGTTTPGATTPGAKTPTIDFNPGGTTTTDPGTTTAPTNDKPASVPQHPSTTAPTGEKPQAAQPAQPQAGIPNDSTTAPGAVAPPVTAGKPQADTDDKTRRHGQAGVAPTTT
ncbi:hypothetical protein [Nocardia acidivorans]|uniref:hypothetical protein n=1 Tax=Nocardia acidivorans TaxID=404580 RepID=UPI00082A18F9|nr:hypothetical protein [Nocardia acidivorans]